MQSIEFCIDGEPVPQGRPRFTVRNKHVIAYDPNNSRAYKAKVQEVARMERELQGWMFKDNEPLKVSIMAFFQIPPSKPKKWQEQAKNNEIAHTKKPDLDNLAKGILDGLSGVLYKDDKQIVLLGVQKFYSDYPRCEVKIVEV